MAICEKLLDPSYIGFDGTNVTYGNLFGSPTRIWVIDPTVQSYTLTPLANRDSLTSIVEIGDFSIPENAALVSSWNFGGWGSDLATIKSRIAAFLNANKALWLPETVNLIYNIAVSNDYVVAFVYSGSRADPQANGTLSTTSTIANQARSVSFGGTFVVGRDTFGIYRNNVLLCTYDITGTVAYVNNGNSFISGIGVTFATSTINFTAIQISTYEVRRFLPYVIA